MDTNRMELRMEQMEQVSGSLLCSTYVPSTVHDCNHPNKVKTPWWGREDDFIFFTRHQNAYLCPDCKEIVWVDEDP